MDRKLAKRLGERILELTQETIKREFGLEVHRLGGSFSSTDFKLKLQISQPIAPIVTQKPAISLEMLRAGLGERGDCILYGGKKYAIVTSRRTKYLVEPVPSTGKQYTIPFDVVTPWSE